MTDLILLVSRSADVPQYSNTTDWTWLSTMFVVVPLALVLIAVIGMSVRVHQENKAIDSGHEDEAYYSLAGVRIRKSVARAIMMVLLVRHQAKAPRGFWGMRDETHPPEE